MLLWELHPQLWNNQRKRERGKKLNEIIVRHRLTYNPALLDNYHSS